MSSRILTASVSALTVSIVVIGVGSAISNQTLAQEKRSPVEGKRPTSQMVEHPHGDVTDLKGAGAPQNERMEGPNEKELRRMRAFLDRTKPKVGIKKSMKTPSGDTVDCVDIRKQPALLRPDMKDHELKLRPSTLPKSEPSKPPQDAPKDYDPPKQARQNYTAKHQLCPEGTVPIRRVTLEELKRFKTLEDFRSKHPSLKGKAPPFLQDDEAAKLGPTDLHQYATVRRYVDNYGSSSTLNLWNPYVHSSFEFSLSQIWVSRGSYFWKTLETVEAGWQKYPWKYNSWHSRLFIYFTPDTYGPGGCYNLECNAFVQVNNTVYIGGTFADYSYYNGIQQDVQIQFYKPGPNGNWWLNVNGVWVGYYPYWLFDGYGLRYKAGGITYGGEIIDYTPNQPHTGTDMGSGFFPAYGYKWAAYQRALRYIDMSYNWQRAKPLITLVTDPDCYGLGQYEATGWYSYFWGIYIYFGGPGYNSQCQ